VTLPTGGRVGRAYVEITSDYDKFAREAETKINAALRKIDLKNSSLDNKVGNLGEDVGDAFQKGFEKAFTNSFASGSARLNARIASSIDNGPNRNRLRNAFDNLFRFAVVGLGGALAGALGGGEGIGKFASSIKEGGSVLSSILPSLSDGLGSFLIKAGLGIIIIPHLAGVIFTLIGNLVSLVGLLNAIPGVAGFAVAALIPLVLAFQNFGGAISAIMDGDPEKIAEALKKLSPAAATVAKQFQALLPAFRDIQKATQEAFFRPLNNVLLEVINTIGTGTIAQGFSNVADALGRFAASFIRLGSAPGVQKLAGILFGGESDQGAVSRILDSVGPPLLRVLDALANAGASTMPTLERLFASIGGWIDKFANWLNEQAANGEFDGFLKSALQTAGDLKDLTGALLDLFNSIFEGTDQGGERFLQKVTKAVEKLTAYFESPEGQDALRAMVNLANAFADFLGIAVGFLQTILSLLGAIDSLTGGRPQGPVEGAVSKATAKLKGKIPGYAAGGVVSQPTFAMISEAGPEAIVPLNDPTRAAQVMGQAGLIPLAENMMAGAGLNVTVFLGTKQITEILDQRVSRGLVGAAGAISRGGRQT
jgi:hypothetical protein